MDVNINEKSLIHKTKFPYASNKVCEAHIIIYVKPNIEKNIDSWKSHQMFAIENNIVTFRKVFFLTILLLDFENTT